MMNKCYVQCHILCCGKRIIYLTGFTIYLLFGTSLGIFNNIPYGCVLHGIKWKLYLLFLFQDMGTIILGKVESGTLKKGQVLTLMPNKVSDLL